MRYAVIIFSFIISTGFSNTNLSPFLPEQKSLVKPDIITAGVANQVYLIDAPNSQKQILKFYKRKSIEDLNHSEQLLQLLRNSGIKVPDSIVAPIQIGSEIISVFSYVKGHHVNDSHLDDVAKLMGKLHLVEGQTSEKTQSKDYDRLFEACRDWEYCEEIKKIFLSLDLSYLDSLPKGLIHGDFSYTNLLVDEENNLTLIDFDHLRHDTLLTDLVRCQLFYGFNQDGSIKQNAIESFATNYNKIRPLKTIELDSFYTHMKLCLIDVALEMYDHMYVKKDLPISRVDDNPLNACLNPNLIAKKILSIKDKTSLLLIKKIYPIFFFGLSGVGKTTLIHLIKQSSDLFYIPKFTVTREPRADDDLRYFEYMSTDEFLKLKDDGKFYIWMNQEGTYYGYQFSQLTDPTRFPLMNSSAYGIDAVCDIKAVKVLIEGNAQKGLELRQNPKVAQTREKINRLALDKFFNNVDFRAKMNLIYFNQFGNPKESAENLKKEIFKELDRAS
jgi:Ser/Thr protein kinase RdoA (MazF antagonist)/guanylate kinase